MSYQWRTITSLSQLTENEIERCFSESDSPFNSLTFLSLLEQHGCVGGRSGWQPSHQLLLKDEQAVGLLIGYIKLHSYGEYVFDWSWADAYQRNGLQYYPKFLSAIPFTPVPTKKWLSSSSLSEQHALSMFLAEQPLGDISGVHYNYPQKPIDFGCEQWIERHGCQFHWFNKHVETGARYTDFDDFLGSLTARKRKNIRKERNKVSQHGISCQWRTGSEVTEGELTAFYQFYQATYLKRGQQGYLNLAFFRHLFQEMDANIRLLVCYKDVTPVAAALYFVDNHVLYGRYWGCFDEYDVLHFEACYYQGIEYCIAHQIPCFNPGTQGEHKIPRGFEPVITYSYHHLQLDPFQDAVSRFCQEEKIHNSEYMQACRERLPYKKVQNTSGTL